MQILKKLFKRKGFTLVELIIVIAIVAILAVSAGMMLTKWLGKAQDTRVIADINQIEKSMDIAYIETAKYPMPDGATTISGDNSDALWYQGKLGEIAIANIDSLTKTPEDPYAKDGLYTYSVTTDQKKYQIGSIATEGTTAYNPYLEEVYTNTFNSIVKGTYNDKFIIKGEGDNKKVYPAPSIIIDDITKYKSGPLNGKVYFVTNGNKNFVKEYEDKTGATTGTDYITWTVGSGTDAQITSALTGAYENFTESGYEEVVTMTEEEVIEEVEKTEGTTTVKASCGSTDHGGTKDFYSTEEVAYGNSCEDVKATFTCDDGTWTHSSEDKTTYSHEMCSVAGAVNCTANSSYTYNTHTYDIPEIPHSSTETTTSNQVNENNGTYTYTLSTKCDNGTYTSESETGPNLVSCNTGYEDDGSGNCVGSQYTVTLNRDGGAGGSTSATATYNQAMPSISIPTKDSCTFGGYFSSTDGGGTKYYNADGSSARSYGLTSNTTLYASWTDCVNIVRWSVTSDDSSLPTNKDQIWVENTLSKTISDVSAYKAACEAYGYKGLATTKQTDVGYGTDPRNGDFATNCNYCYVGGDANQIWNKNTFTLQSDYVPSGITVAGSVINYNGTYARENHVACKLNISFTQGDTTTSANDPSFCNDVTTQTPDYLMCQEN